jgi:hypothetical protein
MATSGTYTFGQSQNIDLIEDAFESNGIMPDMITPQQVRTITRSANFILSNWTNRGLNLFQVKNEVLNLIANQATYLLPTATNNILEATLRTSNRPLGGTAFSSAGGTAQNAFSNNPLLACTQTAPDGYISYDYGANNNYAIQMVGIQSNATLTYTLVAEYSIDNVTWTNSITMPAQVYQAGINVWFVVEVPFNARYYRVRETGGATLNVQELYFNNNLYDTVISPISRSEYIAYPNKNQTGRPSLFYVDRQINPTVTLWPVPIPPYSMMFYSRSRLIQDFGTMQDTVEISQQFFQAFRDELKLEVARKYVRENVEQYTAEALISFSEAARENRERVPLRIYGDYSGGWTQVS